MFIHDQIVNSGTLSEQFRYATFDYAHEAWKTLGLSMAEVIWMFVAA